MDEKITFAEKSTAEETIAEETELANETAEDPAGDAAAEPAEEKKYTERELETELNKRIDSLKPGIKKRLAEKMRRENDEKYGPLTDTLSAATGKTDIGEITKSVREYYAGRGMKIPERPAYSARDEEILADAYADDIISAGADEVAEEVKRLAKKGYANLSPREKTTFKKLAAQHQKNVRAAELGSIGVAPSVYESEDFNSFAAQFNPDVDIKKIYGIYANNTKTEKKEIKNPGSMKNPAPSDDDGVKDYYSPEEAKRFTREQLRKDPALLDAIERSMQKWKGK